MILYINTGKILMLFTISKLRLYSLFLPWKMAYRSLLRMEANSAIRLLTMILTLMKKSITKIKEVAFK